MKITDIIRRGKSEIYKLFVDGSLYCLMEAEIIVKNHIKVGDEISFEKLTLCKEQSDALLCKTMALRFMAKGLKTQEKVKSYLKKNNFSEQNIKNAILKLKEYGYINDEYYAKSLVQWLSENKGKNYIKNKLKQSGVGDEIIAKELENLSGQENACEMVAKKWLKSKTLPLEKKDKEKFYRHMLSKGFEYGVIKSALFKLSIAVEDDDESWD